MPNRRDFYINGESLVVVKGNGALGQSGAMAIAFPNNFLPDPSGNFAATWELGLSSEQVVISPRFVHKDIPVDGFGTTIPPEVLWEIVDCRISMTLIHFDRYVLDSCLAESANGEVGAVVNAGEPMGHGVSLMSSGNHYISLNIMSEVLDIPWHFPSAFLTEQPIRLPLGPGASAVLLNWRAIPYKSPVGFALSSSGSVPSPIDLGSSGTIIWDHQSDCTIDALVELSNN